MDFILQIQIFYRCLVEELNLSVHVLARFNDKVDICGHPKGSLCEIFLLNPSFDFTQGSFNYIYIICLKRLSKTNITHMK
jgi:hypothetical protein